MPVVEFVDVILIGRIWFLIGTLKTAYHQDWTNPLKSQSVSLAANL